MGEVSLSTQLQPNRDVMSSKAYSLGHRRAGTVSLNLSHSEDEPFLQQTKAYRNVSFLITTGEPSGEKCVTEMGVFFPQRQVSMLLARALSV